MVRVLSSVCSVRTCVMHVIFTLHYGTAKVLSHSREQFCHIIHFQVVGVDPGAKYVRYVNGDSDEVKELDYDILLNAAPIDLLVKETKLCPEINVAHNKASAIQESLRSSGLGLN